VRWDIGGREIENGMEIRKRRSAGERYRKRK